jgi:hypothetical protein
MRPALLLVRDGQCIHAPTSKPEHDLAASAQAVGGEKHLVPCKSRPLPRDLFEFADIDFMQDVDHLIFRSHMLCHVRPSEE